MIPEGQITNWGTRAPWPLQDQIEQDLVMSRLIIEIANHEQLRHELVFRGGTCLHKLWLERPLRYSEDLDYVRATAGGAGFIFDALREVGNATGLHEHSREQSHRAVKMILEGPYESGNGTMRIKVEVNVREVEPAQPHQRRELAVDSPWWTGRADVLTFALPELVATKLRALYQRSKGRDLFDLWTALTRLGVSGPDVIDALEHYRPAGFTRELVIANVEAKLQDPAFTSDLDPLLVDVPAGYNPGAAAEVVRRELLDHL